MDLVPPSGAKGERVITQALLRGDRLVFTTLVPEPCNPEGGYSWLMEMDGPTGKRLTETPFDLNGDKAFSVGDYVTVTLNINGTDETFTIPVSGKKSKVGIIGTPNVITAGDKEYKYASGTKNALEVTVESSALGTGRQSWRQLR